MFEFMITSMIIFEGLHVITSAVSCSHNSLSYCSNGIAIEYPFWVDYTNETADFCGYPGFGIKCRDVDDRAVMNISNHLYYVENFNHDSKKLTDVDIDRKECPHPTQNVSLESIPSLHYSDNNFNHTVFYNCSIYPKDAESWYVPCLYDYYRPGRSYHFYSNDKLPGFNWYANCEESVVVRMSFFGKYTQALKSGFYVSWSAPNDCKDCERSGGMCRYRKTTKGFHKCACGSDLSNLFDRTCPQNRTQPNEKKNKTRAEGIPAGLMAIIGVCAGVGGLILVLLLIYSRIFYSFISRWKNNIKNPTNVEVFLESYGCLSLQRYRYSEIKKMTNSFKDSVGEGGYGCVFRGKLGDDGRLVAVKVLNNSKGNGEEFVNEVATIGRTNHVNVVTLLGFCTEGTKRALVYEFMPNGSLERFIYNDKTSSTGSTPSLGWEKLYHIAVGIARGLEYLHCRCNTRILHFDIKPHNILLDEDYCPKISDFGLAKLCPTKESVISMVGARGTMGYIAPEVCCRVLGGVSHKSDVYSYGMMMLEMIGGRKNIDVTVENTSEIYFPHWIYSRLERESMVERLEHSKVEGSKEVFHDEMAKKMIIVALWCIQTHPTNRPSMSKVVEMLEGSTEELQMPPNPSLDPPCISSSSSS
ncbi:hypothetical protein AQUCO_03400113v1 [Aquilegia coerulea]|uniref:non-specific serine/threonine protein kinase n=1 Tax=Aquilegia coerulea TaxID=218851 RepID=A0A2G5CXJ1_AQUCA|nr:hypothetical protein AQUCO_03400113v1 [Aquilegia coerulea]